MKKKLDAIIAVVVMIIGAVVALTPFQLAPVCTKLLELKNGSMTYMACHYTGKAEVIVGVAIALVGLVMLLVKKTDVRHALGIVSAVLGLVMIILPTDVGTGICANEMMACHTTEKVLWVWSGLLIIIGIYSVLRLAQKIK